MCVCVCVCFESMSMTFFLLWDLFFTCYASFFYLVIHSIFVHHIHAFIWILCTPLIIFMFLGWSFIASCTICQSWQKGGEIVENMWFLSKILHVRGRNTCLCKGEMCFILLGGVLTSFFLYTGLVTMFTYMHSAYLWDIYIYIYIYIMMMMMMYVFFTYLYMCCFFSFFIHMFLISYMQSFISVSH